MLAVEDVEVAVSHCIMLETLNVHSCPKVRLRDSLLYMH